ARVINLGYFQNGQAVSCPTNLDLLLGGVVRIVVREHLWLGGVFVSAHVDHAGIIVWVVQQTGEVIVETKLLLGVLGGLVFDIEFRSTFDHWVAPSNQNGLLITFRNDNFVFSIRFNRSKLHALIGNMLHSRGRRARGRAWCGVGRSICHRFGLIGSSTGS